LYKKLTIVVEKNAKFSYLVIFTFEQQRLPRHTFALLHQQVLSLLKKKLFLMNLALTTSSYLKNDSGRQKGRG